MQDAIGEDGCPIFRASISLELADQGKTFRWGVVLDGPQGNNLWGIPTEVHDMNSTGRYRQFRLTGGGTPQVERYYFTYGHRLGANKYFPAGTITPRLRFAVWAPNARSVEVVFGKPASGYIANDGTDIDPTQPVVALSRAADGIWQVGPPGDFETFTSLPYMYRIVNAQGQTVYRTDIFSRSQIGRGGINPVKATWPGTVDTLDGTVSCSVVIDPDVVRRTFQSTLPGATQDLIPDEEFWAKELTHAHPVTTRLDDLVISELHVCSLGFEKACVCDLIYAMTFLDHLVLLGVNAVELLPMAEFSGGVGWGYGDSHHLCIESSAGGRDKYRHFVRECHRRGNAVIQEAVYNDNDNEVEGAEWQYDWTAAEQNIY